MQLTGLISAPHTPFHPDHSLNPDAVAPLATHLAAHGVQGVFVAGTTGECQSLSTEERVRLFHAWGEAAGNMGLTFIAHVGHNSLPDGHALVRAAQTSGADAIGAMAPTFFKPMDAAALVDWFARLVEPARELPFYFYDIPPMTGVTIDTTELVQRIGDSVPSFVGVKYTNPDREQLRAILDLESHSPDMLWGCDEELVDGLELGCAGAVGSSYNFAAPLYHPILRAHAAGDFETARLWQQRSVTLIDALKARGYMQNAKAVMRLLGVDCGPARPPLPQVSPADLESLWEELETMGFFDWVRTDSEGD